MESVQTQKNINLGMSQSSISTTNSIAIDSNTTSKQYQKQYKSDYDVEEMDLSFATLTGAVQNVANTTKKIATSASSWLMDKLEDVGGTIAENITPALTTALDNAKEVTSDMVNNIDKALNDASCEIASKSKSALDFIGEKFNEAKDATWYGITHPLETLERTGASIANTAVGLVQGVGEFGEALVDTSAILGSVIETPVLAVLDGANWLGSKIFDYEFESGTKKMWGEVMDFVATKHVADAFDSFHENNVVGKWLDEKSYSPFKSTGAVYKIADGVGYIGGIIALSLATMGIGGAVAGGTTGATAAGTSTLATINIGNIATAEITKQSVMNAGMAMFAGLGKNTQNAWADGASLGEGLGYGTAMSLWEGFEMFLGSSINSLKLAGVEGVKGQLLNTLSHVALDTIDGSSASFVNPIFQMIYAPTEENMQQIMYMINYDDNGNQISNKKWEDLTFTEKYNALFEYNGGWSSVGINAITAGAVSFLSEIPDIMKAVKKSKAKAQAVNLGDTQPLPVVDEKLETTQSLPKIGDEEFVTEEIPIIKHSQVELDSELKAALDKIQAHSTINAATMKKEILSSIEGIDDPILRAKKLYNELNKRLNYSFTYFENVDNDIGKDIYNQILSFDSLQSDSVICKGWSDLYRELLLESGFSESQIKILGKSNMGSHKWISIDLGNGQSIIADATDAIKGQTDLYNSKMGLPTQGFMILDSTNSNVRPISLYKNGQVNEEIFSSYIRDIDEQLGYADGGYEYEQIINAEKMFGDSTIAKEIAADPKGFAIDQILNSKMPENMDGFEAYVYNRKLIKNITESDDYCSGTLMPQLYSKVLNGEEIPLSVVRIQTDTQTLFQIYSKSTGNIFIDSVEQFNEFIKEFKFVRSG